MYSDSEFQRNVNIPDVSKSAIHQYQTDIQGLNFRLVLQASESVPSNYQNQFIFLSIEHVIRRPSKSVSDVDVVAGRI